MMNTLEWLSKYGLIDIFFGIGIIAYLQRLLKKKIKANISGVDFIPYIITQHGEFSLRIKNQSAQPLYIYQAYIKPGYWKSKVEYSSILTFFKTLMFRFWTTDKFPKMSNRLKTTKGYYILQVQNDPSGLAPSLFVKPFGIEEYILVLEGFVNSESQNLNDLFEKKHFGLFIANYVHGTDSGILNVQL